MSKTPWWQRNQWQQRVQARVVRRTDARIPTREQCADIQARWKAHVS